MKKSGWILLLFSLVLFSACHGKIDNRIKELEAIVTGYGTFGEIVLDVGRKDMQKAGFTPGDCISVTIDGQTFDLPYYTGYFTRNGELLVVDYPNSEHTVFTATNSGVTDRFPEMENKPIRFVLKKKGQYLDIENTLGMVYSINRSDFRSDDEFANAREVATTGMARGVLYRTASPFDNTYNRAPYVSSFLKANGVKTVFDLTDNEERIRQYPDIPEYSRQMIEDGNVVFCKVDANYRGETFNRTVISGLVEMMEHPAPYVVHCTEGKDRTGYVCALLEALAGATYDEICGEYLITYDNYFHITPENNARACQLLLELRLSDAMMFFCDIDDPGQLRSIDLSQAMQQHLVRYGMSLAQVQNLKEILSR